MADGAPPRPETIFLGVERSLSGRAWRRRDPDPAEVRALVQGHSLSEPLARVLAARGVSAATAAGFLSPTLRESFPDPSTFLDMDAAAAAILDAHQAGASLHLFADYDVDGAASAALLVRWFRALGREVPVYVPDRPTEGYGPSVPAFDRLKAAGAELVITVDCGAAANAAVAHAAAIGLKVVVIDHHLMREEPPACAAVVNPNRPGCGSGQGNLAAAGVVFVLLAALNREGRRRGLFADRPEPDLRQWLHLAALGAICDVTALTGFNRTLTRLGLGVLGQWQTPGLKALMEVAGGVPDVVAASHVGFALGPRINAAGRIGRADLGARLLSTDDPAEAAALAHQLDQLNRERREVEATVAEAAVARVEARGDVDSRSVIVVAGEGWHPGVVGVVAGRLRERWRKPVIVAGVDPVAGVAKGSGRSQPGVNLGGAVQAAWEAGLLLAGGGHAMACGLTVTLDALPALEAFLEMRLAGQQAEARQADAVDIDVLVEPAAATRALLDSFAAMQPFGPGNPEPLFALSGVAARDPAMMNGGHVRCRLTAADGSALRAVGWRLADQPCGEALLSGAGGLAVVGRLKPDDWNGRRGVQLEIEDVHDPRRA